MELRLWLWGSGQAVGKRLDSDGERCELASHRGGEAVEVDLYLCRLYGGCGRGEQRCGVHGHRGLNGSGRGHHSCRVLLLGGERMFLEERSSDSVL